MNAPHIVVLGGGFAGIEFCKALKNQPVRITLVDRQNHHLFQPLLYQVASAGLAAPEIAHPIRSIFSDFDNVDVILDEVTAIQLKEKSVSLRDGDSLDYDYLIIGLGVKTGYFGNNEWKKHAPGLKTINDALRIRREILLAFEKAETCEDEADRQRYMTTVVVGGGPTGVELAGAFAEIARHVLKSDFRKIDTSTARIFLVEAAPRLLTMYDEKLSDYTEKKLTSLGVTVKVNTMVKSISDRSVDLGTETIEAGNIIWAAGVEAPKVTRDLGVELDTGGRIVVEGDLSVPGFPEVFALGDIAHCIDQAGKRVPGLCPAAIQMGKHAAKVIADELGTTPAKGYPVRKQFRYFDKGSMATIGRSAAVAESNGMKFDGFIAWLMWLFIHLLFLVGFRNKAAVLLQWIYAYARYRRGARIITGITYDS
ncbi:MAG: NAD(P)/FAD-dependent oxidoreductase [Verrucomicrobiales bacterium]|nr:NAD(P)/FAD-dependent oxidoreductase [Verrucomicrobiales bacterium]